jgi:hypothetical protein
VTARAEQNSAKLGIDRLGRNAAEVMTTIRDLGERGIVLGSIREGTDTSNASGRMVAGVSSTSATIQTEGRGIPAARRRAALGCGWRCSQNMSAPALLVALRSCQIG